MINPTEESVFWILIDIICAFFTVSILFFSAEGFDSIQCVKIWFQQGVFLHCVLFL